MTNAAPSNRRRVAGPPDTTGSGRHNMLIVDDQAVMRALLRDFMQSSIHGLEVSEAGDGARALKLAQERRPQVVLMDINLPDANGIELTARLRELLPDTRVILVTSQAGSAYVERARAAGAFGYVTKDKIYAELAPLVAAALNPPPARDGEGSAT